MWVVGEVDSSDVAVLVGVVVALARLVTVIANEAVMRRTAVRPREVDLGPQDGESWGGTPSTSCTARGMT